MKNLIATRYFFAMVQFMTEAQHYKAVMKAIKAYGEEHCKTPEKARAALIKSGIYDKNGKIKPQFDESLDYGSGA